MGIRGAHDEGLPSNDPGFFLNGFHETWPIPYGEAAFGFATTGQTIVSAPDGSVMRLYVDEEPLVLSESKLLPYERVLDMRAGIARAHRALPHGPRRRRRSCAPSASSSLHWRHLAAISYEVTLVSGQAELAIASELVTHLPRPRATTTRASACGWTSRRSRRSTSSATTRASCSSCARARAASAWPAAWSTGSTPSCATASSPASRRTRAASSSSSTPSPACPRASRSCSATTTPTQAPPGDLVRRVNRTLDRAAGDGFERIAEVQRERLDAFWEHSDIEIDGPEDIQQAVRFNLFQIRQASARVEGHGIAAKGLTGRGYEGQYFWDTEIYVLPVLTYTQPHVARRLLHFRYEMLDAARRRARQLGHRGALFPWRTISGEEASAYYAAGTAQYHINAAISYAVRQFVRVTGDEEFIAREGVEILVETARLWADLGLLLRAPRRAVLHPGRDRPGRVLRRRRQQRLHEPHGAREPRGRRRGPASCCATPIPTPTTGSSRG